MSDLVINEHLTIPARDLSWRAVRASGPGGQNVNKVSTRVELRFDLAGCEALSDAQRARLREKLAGRLDADGCVLLGSQRTRTQTRNLEDARGRLAELIRAALKTQKKRRLRTRPSKGAARRRLENKKRHSQKKATRKRVDP